MGRESRLRFHVKWSPFRDRKEANQVCMFVCVCVYVFMSICVCNRAGVAVGGEGGRDEGGN